MRHGRPPDTLGMTVAVRSGKRLAILTIKRASDSVVISSRTSLIRRSLRTILQTCSLMNMISFLHQPAAQLKINHRLNKLLTFQFFRQMLTSAKDRRDSLGV